MNYVWRLLETPGRQRLVGTERKQREDTHRQQGGPPSMGTRPGTETRSWKSSRTATWVTVLGSSPAVFTRALTPPRGVVSDLSGQSKVFLSGFL